MKKISFLLAFTTLLSCNHNKINAPDKDGFKLVTYNPLPVPKTNPMKLYAHYMPWFESKEVNGHWGMHWTMANQNPDLAAIDGRRQIASHYYPLIGPYSSQDEDVIEYHLLLMKLSGIDGVFIDWYGAYNVFDYQQNRINTEALINRLDEVGLDFAIMYEDYTTRHVVDQRQAQSAIEAARMDLHYLNDNYFTNKNYIRVEDAPLLMVFGPRYLESADQWTQIFSGLNPKPHFITLWFESSDAGVNSNGEFAWVYRNHLSDLDRFYTTRAPNLRTALSSAYPGFNDFYDEGGWSPGLGWEIAHHSTQTLSTTLNRATQADIPIVQLVTWNDFGEGTMIEPTVEFGYSFLTLVQQFSGVDYIEPDLESIHRLYELRKKCKSNAEIQQKLDQVFYYLVSLQIEQGKKLLGDIAEEVEIEQIIH